MAIGKMASVSGTAVEDLFALGPVARRKIDVGVEFVDNPAGAAGSTLEFWLCSPVTTFVSLKVSLFQSMLTLSSNKESPKLLEDSDLPRLRWPPTLLPLVSLGEKFRISCA